MDNNNPEGSNAPGGDEVKLSKEEYDKLVNTAASRLEELTKLREKNRELITNSQPVVQPDEIQKAVDTELKKRDAETLKTVIESATNEFTAAHPEFSPENDKDGSNLAAYQKALGRMNLNGVRTKEQYMQVLEDALRLTEKPSNANPMNIFSSPRSVPSAQNSQPAAHLSPVEQKLVANNFKGDVEAYLKVKAKRPEYIEEILKYVR